MSGPARPCIKKAALARVIKLLPHTRPDMPHRDRHLDRTHLPPPPPPAPPGRLTPIEYEMTMTPPTATAFTPPTTLNVQQSHVIDSGT